MDSNDSMLRKLGDILHDLSSEELSEVAEFVERLRAKRLASATQPDESARRARLQRYTTWTEDELHEFQHWLGARLGEVPRAPVLPPEAFDRSTIYDD